MGIGDSESPSSATDAAFAAWNGEPPPVPKLKSNGIVAMEITEQFSHAAQRRSPRTPGLRNHVLIFVSLELELGELIKDPFFTLFESVGALEVLTSMYLDVEDSH